MNNTYNEMNYSCFFGVISSFMFFYQPQNRTYKSIEKLRKIKENIENAQLIDMQNWQKDWENIYKDIEKSHIELTTIDE